MIDAERWPAPAAGLRDPGSADPRGGGDRAADHPDDEPRVADIMTRRLVAIRSDADLTVAVDVLLRHAVRHLLVVDADRTCRGLVSAEHLLAGLATAGRNGHTVGAHVADGHLRVHVRAPVREAAQVMLVDLVDALPVVDDSGRVVGIVTWTDIVAMVATRHLTVRPARPGR